MIRGFLLFVALCAGWYGGAVRADNHQPEKITAGYLKHWPSPALFAQIKDTFDFALGVEIDWVAFDRGSDMNDAMAAGDLQIAYSQGHVPFLVGVSGGLDLTMVGVAVDYAEGDNCIVRNDSGIGRDNAAQLAGRKIALRKGSLSHFRLLGVLDHLGVDAGSVDFVPVASDEAAVAALRGGEVAMACGSGSALRAMREFGGPLMSGAEQSAIGLKVFDGVTVPTAFVNEHPELVQAFMDIVEASNKQWKRKPQSMLRSIARAADMDRQSASRAMQGFGFPSAMEQKSDAWLGGQIADYTRDLADFFVAEGQLSSALENYERFITTRFLR